ncbi:MAG: alpha/beta fold hydrolase [Steroidobacteraceae bacterium]
MSTLDWVIVGGAALLLVLAAAACALERVAEARDRRRFPPPGRLVDIGGRRLHLACLGGGAGPTVVIEQGAGSPSVTWWPVQARVANFARVCTYDRAGYLWSDPVAPGRSLADRVVDLHTLLDRAELPPPYILVSHSFGGFLARAYARAHPREVAGLVLVDTPHESTVLQASFLRYLRRGARIQSVVSGAARLGLVRLLGRHVPMLLLPDHPAGYALCARPQHPQLLADDLRGLLADTAMLSAGALGSLGDRPLIVLTHGVPFPGAAAAAEQGWQEGERKLAALSSNSELIVAARSSHMIHVDEPEAVVEAIRRVHAAAGALAAEASA